MCQNKFFCYCRWNFCHLNSVDIYNKTKETFTSYTLWNSSMQYGDIAPGDIFWSRGIETFCPQITYFDQEVLKHCESEICKDIYQIFMLNWFKHFEQIFLSQNVSIALYCNYQHTLLQLLKKKWIYFFFFHLLTRKSSTIF